MYQTAWIREVSLYDEINGIICDYESDCGFLLQAVEHLTSIIMLLFN